MGVVNVTPDSFSDGGRFVDPDHAVQHGITLTRQGADLLDIGGESTRPGSTPVGAEEEAGRILPVLKSLRERLPDVLLSVDTSKASVARQAIEAGADLINDVTAGTGDPEMLSVVADSRAGYLLMHMQGTPGSMQQNPSYQHVIGEVLDFLRDRMAAATRVGIAADRLAVDPGIGFGKTLEHNLALLAGLREFEQLDCPLVLGVSRKRWIGDLTGRPVEERLAGSLAGAAACVERGAHVLRVHDVAETRDLVRILDAIRGAGHGEKGFRVQNSS
jgi:dihydropteroate synthase